MRDPEPKAIIELPILAVAILLVWAVSGLWLPSLDALLVAVTK